MKRNVILDVSLIAAAVTAIIAAILGGMIWIIDARLGPLKAAVTANKTSIEKVHEEVKGFRSELSGIGQRIAQLEVSVAVHNTSTGRFPMSYMPYAMTMLPPGAAEAADAAAARSVGIVGPPYGTPYGIPYGPYRVVTPGGEQRE